MGLAKDAVRALFIAKEMGACYDEVLMIGRQHLLCTKKDILDISRAYGQNEKALEDLILADEYSEPLFYALGAQKVDSLDFSDYEKATILHDLNMPVPDTLKGKYSIVVDGGALEHIFNFPMSIKNCMEMVKLNGFFIMATIGNNYMGHGFYQFSPELFYRVLSLENGFRVEQMFLVTKSQSQKRESWYTIADPNEVQSRINICNKRPVNVIVIAKKIANAAIFSTTPQQSDYQAMWTAAKSKKISKHTGRLISAYKKYVPFSIKRLVHFFRKSTKTTWDLGEVDYSHIKKYTLK